MRHDSSRAVVPPAALTIYFMGLDHYSHQYGPEAQFDYLAGVVDPQIGRLTVQLRYSNLMQGTLFAVVSDHGHIRVIHDDRHSLRMSYPFDREMAYLFDALGLDVNDVPGEGPNCNAVVASNGGLAHVYLQHRSAGWKVTPRWEEEILPVARAFWEAHQTGRYAPDLQGALSMVLVRLVDRDGWLAPYQALTSDGRLVEVADFLAEHPEIKTVDAPARLRALAGTHCGEILLVSNYAEQFYFGGPTTGVHGGLHPHDSLAVASLGWSGASPSQLSRLRELAQDVVQSRRRSEGREYAAIEDTCPILIQLMGWSSS